MFKKEYSKDVDSSNGEINTIIGALSKVEGNFISDSNTRIDGSVDGEIDINGQLTIGESAKIKAKIKTEDLVVYGSIEGNIEAVGNITIHKSGKVIGDISLGGDFVIEPGAIFVGTSKMQEKNTEDDLDDVDIDDDLKDEDLDVD